MHKPHIHVPSGHVAVTGFIGTHAFVTLASHWIDHTVEAFCFAFGAIFAACAADAERKWNEHFHGKD